MLHQLLRASIVVLLLGAVALHAWVTGKVVDGTGKGVADAMVSYVNLANRLIYVYTDANGNFAIPGPTEWSIKDLPMYKDPTPIIRANVASGSTMGPGLLLQAAGDKVYFRLDRARSVSLEVFSLDGRRLRASRFTDLAAGRYGTNPLADVRQGIAVHQTCVARVSSGSEIASVKITNMGQTSCAQSMGNAALRTDAGLVKLALISAVDQLRAGKTNFSPTTKDINSYSENAGNLTIQARDIEGEVNTLMAGKSKNWKAGQCTQGCDGQWNSEWGTYFYSWSHNQPFATRANTLNGYQNQAISAAGIGQMMAIDAIHGFSLQPQGTIFPHNIGMGASGNGPLIDLMERICAIECRAQGINWNFAPCIDIVRNERHGRTYEGWDEGPDGSAKYAYYAVRGLQGTDLSHPMTVAATIKHFAGAGGTMNGVHGTDCNTSNDYNVLARIHLPPFRRGCETGAATVMAAFNSWMGTEMHYNSRLLTDSLKNGWRWDGFITGDWEEATAHGVARCVSAGLDNPMTPANPGAARSDINANCSDARVDDACRRILRVKSRMNLKTGYAAHTEYIPFIKSTEHIAVARECVRRSLVLLKNNASTLPIARTANVHVVGKWADDMGLQCGGWTISWQAGANKDLPAGTSIYEGIQQVCTGKVTYGETATNIPADAGVVIVAVGEVPYAEGLGDRTDLSLTTEHKNLVAACKASGKKVVCLLISGRPMIVTTEVNTVDAFVAAWLPGTQGGGVADVLFNVNGEKFTAKLSHTWPSSMAQIPINTGSYGDLSGTGGTPLFAYGYGLSYP